LRNYCAETVELSELESFTERLALRPSCEWITAQHVALGI